MGPLDLPSMRGLYRTDGTRPDGVTMIPWEMGKQLMWDVTVVDALSPSRLHQGSLSNPETTVTEAEAGKIEMYRKLKDNGYIFQQGGLVLKQFGWERRTVLRLISYDQTWFMYLHLQLMVEVVQHRIYIAPRQVHVSQQKCAVSRVVCCIAQTGT